MTTNKRTKKRTGSYFYEKVLAGAEKIEYADADSIEGLDGEIAILRVKIQALMKDDPEGKNTKLVMSATNMVMKLVKARYGMDSEQKNHLGEAIKNVVREIGVPLGAAIIAKKF